MPLACIAKHAGLHATHTHKAPPPHLHGNCQVVGCTRRLHAPSPAAPLTGFEQALQDALLLGRHGLQLSRREAGHAITRLGGGSGCRRGPSPGRQAGEGRHGERERAARCSANVARARTKSSVSSRVCEA